MLAGFDYQAMGHIDGGLHIAHFLFHSYIQEVR